MKKPAPMMEGDSSPMDTITQSAYRKSIGILLTLVGITALVRTYLQLPTGMSHLWPMFPLSVGIPLIVSHIDKGKGRWGLLLAGILLSGISVFFCLFTLNRTPWSEMSRLWPVFLFLAGLSFCVSIATRDAGRILSLWILGWAMMADSLAFLLFTHQLLAWNRWPVVPIASGLWFIAAAIRQRPSTVWLVLGIVTQSAGLFLFPFAQGWLNWTVIHRYQSILFIMTGLEFFLVHTLRGGKERAFYSTAMIIISLGGITLLGPLFLGWERFGWNLWPIMLVVIGGGLLMIFGMDPKSWAAWIPGTILVLLGAFLGVFTLGRLPWEMILYLWPTLPGIIGLSLMMGAVAGGFSRLRTLFFVGLTIDAIAVLLYLFALWPIGLLAAGILLMGPFPRRRDAGEKPSSEDSLPPPSLNGENHPNESGIHRSNR